MIDEARQNPDRASVQRATEIYFSFFQRELWEILRIESRTHRKILLVTMLAALSEGRYSTGSDGDKFKRLVRDYGDWADGERVSVVQLDQHVRVLREKVPKNGGISPAFVAAIDQHIAEAERVADASELRPISTDPLPTEFFSGQLTGDESAAVERASHLSLLYQYRSTLVHEFRESGYGFEFDQQEATPYYVSTTLYDGSQSIELTYPLGLLSRIAEAVLKNLREWYLAENRDPYEGHQLGPRWIRDRRRS